MEGVNVSKVISDGKRPNYFIARHEESRMQFSGDTEADALFKMEAFLSANPRASAPAPRAKAAKSRKR